MKALCEGRIVAIRRYPVKGFTGETLAQAQLCPGRGLPLDRRFTVEQGPSGFDPARPAHVSKQKFAVLAACPQVAAVRMRFDGGVGAQAEAPGAPPFVGDLGGEAGQAAFAQWLGAALGDQLRGPLRMFDGDAAAGGGHRFYDHPQGHVSLVNLASVRDLEARLGRAVDPERFRANLWVEGWPAWMENELAGASVTLGEARALGFAPIVRCAAVDVDPQTAEADMQLTQAIFDLYGHRNCGLYVHVQTEGTVRVGDTAAAEPAVATDAEPA